MNKIEEYWINNTKNRLNNDFEYLSWFYICNNIEEYFRYGYIDFFNRILTNNLYSYLGDPTEKVSLEIGFGGGRLINAATSIFKHCYGIDIINKDCINKTKEILNSNNKYNFTLLNFNERNTIKENSIDFIYSFKDIQYFSSMTVLIEYIKYTKKILSMTGCGIFYFKKIRNNNNDFNTYIVLDSLENERDCSLFINKEYAKNLMEKYFRILEVGEITTKLWNKKKSGLYYIKFKQYD